MDTNTKWYGFLLTIVVSVAIGYYFLFLGQKSTEFYQGEKPTTNPDWVDEPGSTINATSFACPDGRIVATIYQERTGLWHADAHTSDYHKSDMNDNYKSDNLAKRAIEKFVKEENLCQ